MRGKVTVIRCKVSIEGEKTANSASCEVKRRGSQRVHFKKASQFRHEEGRRQAKEGKSKKVLDIRDKMCYNAGND